MPRKPIFAVVLVVLSAGFARAQVYDITTGRPDGNYLQIPAYEAPISWEQQQERARIERDYRAAVAKIPDKKPSNDPWKTVRTAPTAAPPPDRHRIY